MQGGFDTFWEYTKNDIQVTLRQFSDELEPVAPSCNSNSNGWVCTACVCTYRNKVVEAAMSKVDQALGIAKAQAATMFTVNLDKYIAAFHADTVDPWKTAHSCSSPDNNVVSNDPK